MAVIPGLDPGADFGVELRGLTGGCRAGVFWVVSSENQRSTRFGQELEVGVKCR